MTGHPESKVDNPIGRNCNDFSIPSVSSILVFLLLIFAFVFSDLECAVDLCINSLHEEVRLLAVHSELGCAGLCDPP